MTKRRKARFRVGQVVCIRDGKDILTGKPIYQPARVISLPTEGSGNMYGLEGIFHTTDAKESDLRPLTARERGPVAGRREG